MHNGTESKITFSRYSFTKQMKPASILRKVKKFFKYNINSSIPKKKDRGVPSGGQEVPNLPV